MNDEYLLDPIERGEAKFEAWETDNMRGDEFKCSCGKWTPMAEAETLSGDPYAIPVCGQCFLEAFPNFAQEAGR